MNNFANTKQPFLAAEPLPSTSHSDDSVHPTTQPSPRRPGFLAERFTIADLTILSSDRYIHPFHYTVVSFADKPIPMASHSGDGGNRKKKPGKRPPKLGMKPEPAHWELVALTMQNRLTVHWFMDVTGVRQQLEEVLQTSLSSALPADELAQIRKEISRANSELNDKVLRKAVPHVADFIKSCGEWPSVTAGPNARSKVWARFTILPVIELMFSQLGNVVDFVAIMERHEKENRKMKTWVGIWFAGMMEVMWSHRTIWPKPPVKPKSPARKTAQQIKKEAVEEKDRKQHLNALTTAFLQVLDTERARLGLTVRDVNTHILFGHKQRISRGAEERALGILHDPVSQELMDEIKAQCKLSSMRGRKD